MSIVDVDQEAIVESAIELLFLSRCLKMFWLSISRHAGRSRVVLLQDLSSDSMLPHDWDLSISLWHW